MLGRFQRSRRKVISSKPYRAILGDGSGGDGGNVYAGDGYYWVRPYGAANVNNFATPGTAYRVQAGSALIVPRAGFVVWVGPGMNQRLTILSYDHDDLILKGIDPTSTQPNDPYRSWIRLKNIQNFRALPIATGTSPSLLVSVRQLFYYTNTGDIVRWNGTNADTHIDLTDYVPSVGFQCYVVLWLRTYNPNSLSDIQVTFSDHIDSVDLDLSFTELQQCADSADADTIPIGAFRLADAQTTLKIDDTIDVDLRQFINMPQVWGFPNTVARAYRVHEGFSVIAPSAVIIEDGGVVEVQSNAVLLIDDFIDEDSGGTVTSVGLVMPVTIFDVTGSPITGDGTFTVTLDTQAANTFLAGATGGAAAVPTFRAIVSADINTALLTAGGIASTVTDAATATVTDVLTIDHESTGTPTTGFGTGFLLQGESSTTPAQDMARIRSTWTTATHASRSSSLIFSTWAIGVETDVLTLTPSGTASDLNVRFGTAGAALGAGRVTINQAASSKAIVLRLNVTSPDDILYVRNSTDAKTVFQVNALGGIYVQNSAGDRGSLDGGASWSIGTDISNNLMIRSNGSIDVRQSTELRVPATLAFPSTTSISLNVNGAAALTTTLTNIAAGGAFTGIVKAGGTQSTTDIFQVQLNAGTPVFAVSSAGIGTHTTIDAVTNAVTNGLVLRHNSTGTAAAGFGGGILFASESSTTDNQSVAVIEAPWITATDASRAGALTLNAYYTTTKQEGVRIVGDTAGVKLSFFGGATPVIRPVGANQAAVTTTTSTNIAPWGYATQAQADEMFTLQNAIRQALIDLNLWKGSA